MRRREFIRRSGAAAGLFALREDLLAMCTVDEPPELVGTGGGPAPMAGSILELPAREAPIDHVVVLMMENRSFDHYLGWLGTDDDYLEAGRRRYGADFRVDGVQSQSFPNPRGELVDTFHLTTSGIGNPYRGCGFADPAHGWGASRAARDGGFLDPETENDRFALGYYNAADLPIHERMVRRFTTFDRYFSSLLGPTQPNREYFHAAQSGGHKNNYLPILELGFNWRTIWDNLRDVGVSVRNYYADLPAILLWGQRMEPIMRPIDQYFTDAARGDLPSVTFLEPPYSPWWQADDHPWSDMRNGQRFIRDCFRAFVESEHWERGLFVLTYDEGGGFFDHVTPPVLPDNRASVVDSENFGQAGFRVPTILASPYAKRGYVDHRVYDHTSITRFLEWRFLGAPPEGPGVGPAPWALTQRDLMANNIGASLGYENPDYDVFEMDGLRLTQSDLCWFPAGQQDWPGRQPDYTAAETPGAGLLEGGYQSEGLLVEGAPTTDGTNVVGPADVPESDEVRGPANELLDALNNGYFEQVGFDGEPSPMAGTWAQD